MRNWLHGVTTSSAHATVSMGDVSDKMEETLVEFLGQELSGRADIDDNGRFVNIETFDREEFLSVAELRRVMTNSFEEQVIVARLSMTGFESATTVKFCK